MRYDRDLGCYVDEPRLSGLDITGLAARPFAAAAGRAGGGGRAGARGTAAVRGGTAEGAVTRWPDALDGPRPFTVDDSSGTALFVDSGHIRHRRPTNNPRTPARDLCEAGDRAAAMLHYRAALASYARVGVTRRLARLASPGPAASTAPRRAPRGFGTASPARRPPTIRLDSWRRQSGHVWASIPLAPTPGGAR